MTQRERWQALQARLSAAQALIEAGERQKALAEVNAALALDPDFLAAQALRDRLLKNCSGVAIPAPPAKPAPAAAVTNVSAAATGAVEILPKRATVPATWPPAKPMRAAAANASAAGAVETGPKSAAVPATWPPDKPARAAANVSGTGAVEVTPKAAPPAAATPATNRQAYDPDTFRVMIPGGPSPSVTRPGTPAPEASVQPQLSAEKFAHFEARAKRRRVDRRIEAARAAMGRRKLHEAASVLDEIITLDPNLPELAALTAEFDELRKASASSHRGPWLTAAAVFALGVLGASYLHESTSLPSFPVKTEVPLVEPPRMSLRAEPSEPQPSEPPVVLPAAEPPAVARAVELPAPKVTTPPAVATAGVRDAARTPPLDRPERAPAAKTPAVQPAALPALMRDRPSPEPERTILAVPALPATAPPPSEPQPSPALLTPPASPLTQPVALPRTAPPPPHAVAAVNAPSPAAATAVPSSVDDERLVQQTLQRYRNAYEGLDAESAHAVWPAVNQAQLARAFQGLASQAITFETCNVAVRGASASATCRGTARYVPKIGSREPRVESRVWNFALKKDGADWKIDSARTDQ